MSLPVENLALAFASVTSALYENWMDDHRAMIDADFAIVGFDLVNLVDSCQNDVVNLHILQSAERLFLEKNIEKKERKHKKNRQPMKNNKVVVFFVSFFF